MRRIRHSGRDDLARVQPSIPLVLCFLLCICWGHHPSCGRLGEVCLPVTECLDAVGVALCVERVRLERSSVDQRPRRASH